MHNHADGVVDIQVGAGQGHIVQYLARPGGIVIRVHVKMGDTEQIAVAVVAIKDIGGPDFNVGNSSRRYHPG